MTPDELRALADAIVYRDPLAIARVADYLRAQTDVQPVAWRCEVRGDGSNPAWDGFGWRHYNTTTSEREALAFVERCGNGIEGRAVPLYTHPAPAAPQAEPKRPAFLDEIDRAKEHIASWPQWMKDATVSAAATLPVTEPKREPSAAEWLSTDDAETHLAAAMRDAARITPPSDDKAILDALKRRGIWLAQIGGSNE